MDVDDGVAGGAAPQSPEPLVPGRRPELAVRKTRRESDVHQRTQIWLYLSGGGLRSAMGGLGAVWFLEKHLEVWDEVSRVSSVSGGSLANATLMRIGGNPGRHLTRTYRRYLRHGGPWLYWLTIVAAAVAAVIVWGFTRWDWWWRRGVDWGSPARSGWILVSVLALLVLVLGLFQLVLSVYLHDRIRYLSERERWGRSRDVKDESDRLHFFAATDMISRLPVYFVTRRRSSPASGQTPRATVLAHDTKAQHNEIIFTMRDWRSPTAAIYSSAAWPVVTYPMIVRGDRHADSPDEIHLCPGERDPEERLFALMDGGMTGTLGTQLDPGLYRAPERLGLMGVVHRSEDMDAGPTCDDLRNDPVRRLQWNQSIQRVVVDGGQHTKNERLASLTVVPGLGGIVSAFGAVKVGLNHQITVDRTLVDNRSDDVWYVPLTGAGKHFAVRQWTPTAPVEIRMRRGVTRLDVQTLDPATDPHRDHLLLRTLRAKADKVGNFPVPWRRKHAVACGAAAVAAMHAEVYGLGTPGDAIIDLVDDFQQDIRLRGVLEPWVRCRRTEDPSVPHWMPPYRWPELRQFVGTTGPLFVTAHRGDSTSRSDDCTTDPDEVPADNVDENTVAAFLRAHARGARVLECDALVARAPDGKGVELVAIHGSRLPLAGWVRKGIRFRRISRLTRGQLAAYTKTEQEPEKIEDIIKAVAEAGIDVRWNFEAKTRTSMNELLALVARLRGSARTSADSDAAPVLDHEPLISAGWSTSKLKRARLSDPEVLTAIGFAEKVRLLHGGTVIPQAAAVQLSTHGRFAWRRVARHAHRNGLQVYWYTVNKPHLVEKLADPGASHADGFITDDICGIRGAVERVNAERR